MSLDKPARSNSVQHHLLPKSVKVRSTCNACQQAKIRCSHEKPSCRRCQKHNIECIYSMSRRLGRPAKKKDPVSQDDQPYKCDEGRRSQKRVKPAKKKSQEGSDNTVSSKHLEESIDDTSIEDSLQTPLLTDVVDTTTFSDSMDFASDPWLQDFMSSQSTDRFQDRGIFDPFEPSKIDSAFPSLSAGSKDHTTFHPLSSSSSDPADITLPLSNCFPFDYANGNTLHPTLTPPIHDMPTPATTAPRQNFHPISPQLSTAYHKNTVLSAVDTFLPHLSQPATITDPEDLLRQPLNSVPTEEFPPSFENSSLDHLSPPTQLQSQCQCYESALRELLRVNICVSRHSPTTQSSSIDAILTCQRGLQQLAETVLQCSLCSRARVNLLMVIIVSVDSLLSVLEATTSSSCTATASMGLGTGTGTGTGTGMGKSGLFDPLSDEEIPSFDPPIPISIPISVSSSSGVGRRCKDPTSTGNGTGSNFKAQIEACPLVVGSFRIPLDEKYCFIKQLLHARLSGLLATIRRIRFSTQQGLGTSSASRGRLIMMMETDRRLQVVMMRVKMLSR
ncbi:hypothetical protein PHISCL_07069 [Aspergillus sclerotialis]|uniref:Zn(2)-C6 fungal-type domain-containing protein n=1 Tax=Aspergillus sclerotialis TaxID=2070753 RepID=A0A3A2ZCF1_9EURO|nr:hypothetical protein PHISCL_07069 [Aspergillus sclerotialis]